MAKAMSECNPGRNHSDQLGCLWKAGRYCWRLDQEAESIVMAILNVTPDSFSDGGLHVDLEAALEAARRFVQEGASILDVGGESTRPGAKEVSEADELRRVVPLIRELGSREPVALSVDTCKPVVAREALLAGASIVNDVTGFRDPAMIDVCASSDCGVVVMHMQGNPRMMQKNPQYVDVLSEVREFFQERFEKLTEAGVDPQRIVFDPGIGFGKTLAHNLALLHGIDAYRMNDRPILMGLSRKSLIGQLIGEPGLLRRENPTQALTALTRSRGAMIHRVHRVSEALQILRMTEAIR